MLYDDDHIYGSPYQIKVYDPSQVKIFGLEGGTVGTGLTFNGKVTLTSSVARKRVFGVSDQV